MKKRIQILCVLIGLCASFMIGWRVMPKIWPTIRLNYINRLIPQLAPSEDNAKQEEEKTPLYTPKSSSQYGDPISTQDSLIYYFYKDTCPYCLELEPLIAALPDQITLPDGSASKVRLICLNKNEEKYASIIADFYQEHDIHEDNRLVPSIVIGKRYLYLRDAIVDQLMNALVAGEGLDTQMLEGEKRQ